MLLRKFNWAIFKYSEIQIVKSARWKGEGALLGIRATLSGVFMATSPDSRHTAPHRSAQISLPETLYVRKPLSEIHSAYLRNVFITQVFYNTSGGVKG